MCMVQKCISLQYTKKNEDMWEGIIGEVKGEGVNKWGRGRGGRG